MLRPLIQRPDLHTVSQSSLLIVFRCCFLLSSSEDLSLDSESGSELLLLLSLDWLLLLPELLLLLLLSLLLLLLPLLFLFFFSLFPFPFFVLLSFPSFSFLPLDKFLACFFFPSFLFLAAGSLSSNAGAILLRIL